MEKKSNKEIIAAAYCRASHSQQVLDNNTIPRQEERLREFARQKGITKLVVLKDEGYSGYKDRNRPAFQKLVRLCKSGEINALFCTSLDRISRSLTGTLRLFDEVLIPNDVEFHSLDGLVSTDTPAGRLQLSLIATFAEYYRNDIAHKVRISMRELRRKRQKTGGLLQYGVRLAEDGRTLVPHPDEAAALRLMVEMKRNHATLRQIAIELERRGIATRTGRAVWQPKTIKMILDRLARDEAEADGSVADGGL